MIGETGERKSAVATPDGKSRKKKKKKKCVPSDHLALCQSSGGSRGELWGFNPPLNFQKVRSPAWPCDRFSCRIIYVDQTS